MIKLQKYVGGQCEKGTKGVRSENSDPVLPKFL